MENCIFCRILSGEITAEIIHKDIHCIALMDRFPLSPGHTLVISRQHVPHVEQLDPAQRTALLETGTRISGAMPRAFPGSKATHFLINNGKAANQHIPHVHLHIIPRYGADLQRLCRRFVTRFLNPMDRLGGQAKLAHHAQQLRAALDQPVMQQSATGS